MKKSGRTLKQRLYGLKHLSLHIGRARHFRGHGVHSPYVYSIVREVFMRSELLDGDTSLHDTLIERHIAKRRAIQLQNLVKHCKYESWAIDAMAEHPFIVVSTEVNAEQLNAYNCYAQERGATLCIMSPYESAERWRVCCDIVENHKSTTVDNRAYLLIFNNHLPKQRFRL